MADPQKRFTTFPPASFGIPARTAADRPIIIPCGPSGKAHPTTTSSMSSGFTFSFRANSPLMTWAVRSSGRMPTN